MNIQVIRELVTKSDKDSALALVPTETLLKFAELIVKECVLETMDAIHHDTGIRTHLYNHFGVEE